MELIEQLPEEKVAMVLAYIRELDGEKDRPDTNGVIIGLAKGRFVVPEDFDDDNELIADLFEGRSEE